MENESINKSSKRALFFGLCILAVSIYFASSNIASSMSHITFGSFPMPHIIQNTPTEPSEFMTDWQAANFLSINEHQLISLIEAGELQGTYTIMEIEQINWWWPDDHFNRGHFYQEQDPFAREGQGGGGGIATVAPPPRQVQYMYHSLDLNLTMFDYGMPYYGAEYEIVLVDHRLFSRERLAQYMLDRIDAVD